MHKQTRRRPAPPPAKGPPVSAPGFRGCGTVAFNRTTSAFAIFAWLAVLALLRRGLPLAALGAVAVVLLLLTRLENASSVLGVVLGAIVFLFAAINLRRTLRFLSVLVVAGGLAAPFLSAEIGKSPSFESVAAQLQASHLHRLFIWQFAGERVLERPLWGWGLDSSRAMPGHAVDLAAEIKALNPAADNRGAGVRNDPLEAMPLHPHNAILQLWLELGLPGALIGLAAAVFALHSVARLGFGRWEAAAAAALVVTALVVALLSYGIWQVWWMSILWLAGGGLLTLARTRAAARSSPAAGSP